MISRYKNICLVGSIFLLFVSCASTNIDYPDKYEKCTHVASNQVIKFVEEEVKLYKATTCPEYLMDSYNECPKIIIIDDLYGVRHNLSGLEIENYKCETIKKEDEE